ncbi:MAG: hypothetical protein ACYSWS_01885 [Planctomycetota bacterium]|jgi:hypothetical protein
MNSPIGDIEEGILNGNWETVCEGFERLTGQHLPVPGHAGDSEAMQKIHDIASTALGLDAIAEICDMSDESKKKKKKPGRRKGSGKTTVTKDGEDSSLQLDESKKTVVQKQTGEVQLITNEPIPEEVKKNKIRAKKSAKNKLQLKRNVATTYKVECNECGGKFDSDRKSGEMGQKCSKCLNKLKSRFV